MTDKTMTCASVDELLLGILEGDVSAETSAAVEAHVSECARCTALLRDLEGIRDGAAALPDLAPSADLWKGIADRIETPVVALGERKPTRFAAPMWIAAAASLLVVASSGITYWATTRSIKPQPATQTVASVPAVVNKVDAPAVDAQSGQNASELASNVSSEVPSAVTRAGNRSASARMVSNTARRSAFAPDTILRSEISRLQRVIAERRQDLDPQTVKIVEMNLNLIDAAIKSSRAALAKDPASGFLNQQLTRALDKKVELLRTVALLPSST
jgi:hypothetical protein